MMKGVLGIKRGMTQVFGDKGIVIPVTVVEAGPCQIVQVKTKETDGYEAVVVGFGEKRKSLVNKPMTGQFKKAGISPKRYLKEFRVEAGHDHKVGGEFKADVFSIGDIVDVTAKTKGRGFTGVIKRWNQARVGPMSHGTGPVHRHVGSMGANSCPSRVFKNKHMAGQYGNEQVTIQNLTIVGVDVDKNCLLIKGGIPGPDGSLVVVKSAVKKQGGAR
ncbi:MAG: 50S ribosomal protein L3 [Firmicutes bacterium]|nr:50S ribosomal protein L3 [Bacillota bacterium]